VGRVTVEVWREEAGWEATTGMRFFRTDTGEEILAEKRVHFSWPGAHVLEGDGHGTYAAVQQFRAEPGERLYGMGGHVTGRLNLAGSAFDLVQRNGEVCIPWVVSSRGYGLLWNHPGTGRVEFGTDATRWTAAQTHEIDYWITVGDTPAELLAAYADATGHAPVLPDWALGLWQSTLRYTHQDQIVAVAKEYAERGLDLSVIVSDAGHWPAMGEYRFDPAEYPDPAAMMRELDSLGVKLMVSVWPTVNPMAPSYASWREDGFLVAVDQGVEFHTMMGDKLTDPALPLALVDATNPGARSALWAKAKEGYYDLGVRTFWLDADEPEHLPGTNRSLSFYAGPGDRVVDRYPFDMARTFADNADDVLMLSRSAWAGQQRLGCAVWSGDIPATWDSLSDQVRVGLSIALSGIPWWTTDIGGFFGGDPSDPEYRELFVRWMQYGAMCPLFRIHGIRDPRQADDVGGPAEIWAFGEETYPLLADVVRQREALRPYLSDAARVAAGRGVPPMRPLFVDFPEDTEAWAVEDEYMLGPDLLVAPVTAPGVRERRVYLPAGASWRDRAAGTDYEGGTWAVVPAPLSRIPVLTRIAPSS
jgi:alpha-D-xyloside xylohydrolase